MPVGAEGAERARQGRLVIEPAYDGVYGAVRIWQSATQPRGANQSSLIGP